MLNFRKQSNHFVAKQMKLFIPEKQKLITCEEFFYIDKRNSKFKETVELTVEHKLLSFQ